jgi:glucose 1-dehydrogenase
MKAVAVRPRVANSIFLKDVPPPRVEDVPHGRGVLVRVLRVGGCGTDLDIEAGDYGQAPPGDDYLIIGHENLGQIVAVGPNVPPRLTPGTHVVSTVRRPGHSVYDRIGMQDMTTDDVYYERGINLLHGYMAEQYVEDAGYVLPLPPTLDKVGVLLEPMSVVEKGIYQAYEIQRRMHVWQPRKALVLGAGPVGLLGALVLSLRGLDVTCASLETPPTLRSELIGALNGHYETTHEQTLSDISGRRGPFDVIVEATGYSPLAWQAAEVLGKNGVLVLASVTGGQRTADIPSDRINQSFVLGNKVMVGTVNASYADFARGVDHLIAAEAIYPNWIGRLLTTPVRGLDQYAAFMQQLKSHAGIKVYLDLEST